MANQYTSEYTDEIIERMITLAKVHKLPEVTKMINKEFGTDFTYSGLRTKYMREKDNWKPSVDPVEETTYRETIKYHEDGSVTKNTLIEIANGTEMTPTFLLRAHGFKPSVWRMIDCDNSVWNQHNKEDGTVTLYSSKIRVKPKEDGYDLEELMEAIKQVPTYTIEPPTIDNETYLNIPLADMHFTIATYDDYKQTQSDIIHLIQKGHKEILFILGNDLFHHNDHRNRTASGREIEQGDIIQAWEDAKLFYYPLLEYALNHSEKVKVMYIKGNHSESMEWAFVQMLKERFKQVQFDDEFKERKVTMLGLNYIGATHGDKKKMQSLTENFAVEFPLEWSKAKTRTVYTGHLHHERVIDKGGVILRQLPSGIKADQWHEDKGYTTAHKRFLVHEFTYDKEKCIHYV